MKSSDHNRPDNQSAMSWFPEQESIKIGFWQRIQLAWRLFWNGRVRVLPKLFPLLALGYVLSPVDLVPEIMLGPLGALDDIGILILGINILIWLSPYHIVLDHLQDMGFPVSQTNGIDDRNAVEANYRTRE